MKRTFMIITCGVAMVSAIGCDGIYVVHVRVVTGPSSTYEVLDAEQSLSSGPGVAGATILFWERDPSGGRYDRTEATTNNEGYLEDRGFIGPPPSQSYLLYFSCRRKGYEGVDGVFDLPKAEGKTLLITMKKETPGG